MSSTLYWIPVAKREGYDLPDALKFILRERYSLDHGETVLDSGALNYLQGLSDAKVDGAEDLIKAIQKYNEVKLYLEY